MWKSQPTSILLLFFIFLFNLEFGLGKIVYNAAEADALKKFHGMVDSTLPHEYMKGDEYLINWIRTSTKSGVNITFGFPGGYYFSMGQGYDLDKAASRLQETLEWREENEMDAILQEDFSELEKNYPFKIQGMDKDGNPLLLIQYANWDIKEAVESTSPSKFIRYLEYMLERGAHMAREAFNSTGTPSSTLKYNFFFDVGGFTQATHACDACLFIFPTFLRTLETHYPGQTKRILQVNAPKEFNGVGEIFSKFVEPDTGKQVKQYGNNREEWLKEIGKVIELDQIPMEFLGTTTTTAPTTTTPLPPTFAPFKWIRCCAGCRC